MELLLQSTVLANFKCNLRNANFCQNKVQNLSQILSLDKFQILILEFPCHLEKKYWYIPGEFVKSLDLFALIHKDHFEQSVTIKDCQ